MNGHEWFGLGLLALPFLGTWGTLAIVMRSDTKREEIELDETRKMLKEAR